MELIVLKLLDILMDVIGRLIMKPLIKLWEAIWSSHLKKAVRNEDYRIKADLPYQELPYISLTWELINGSETSIEVRRIYGTLYIGNRRLTNFDAHNPIQKNILAGNRQQYLTIQRTVLKKGERSGIEINFYPSHEFWLQSIEASSPSVLLDGTVEVHSHGLNIPIPLIKDGMTIENIERAISKYHSFLRERFNTLKT